jgi:hypothetical protein
MPFWGSEDGDSIDVEQRQEPLKQLSECWTSIAAFDGLQVGSLQRAKEQ